MIDPSRFIVIDDDPTSNMICRMVIQKYLNPIDVEVFTSPSLGLEYIVKTYTDTAPTVQTILFLDIHMPIITGWEFLQKLEKKNLVDPKTFKIYILSSTIEEREMVQSKKSGMVTDYLIKPLTREKVNQVFSI